MEGITSAANTPEKTHEVQPPNKPQDAPAERPPAEVKPAEVKSDKPEEKSAEKPAAKPAPATTKEVPAELRRRVDELSKSEKQLKAELETLRKEREELSKKRTWSEDDQKRFEESQKEAAELRRQIAESAYERSDEFKKSFVQPYEAKLKNAISTTIRYFPVTNAETGESRAATEADFWKVASAPISDRAAIAQNLFGANAANIIADIRRLEDLKEGAEQAISNHNQGLEAREKQSREEAQKRQTQYAQFRELSRKQLTEEFKDFFGDVADDPELDEAWKKGVEFVDTVPTQAEKMTLEELAAVQEVVRARAAWFPRGHKELTRAKAKIAQLEEELSKFRSSDPGAEKEKGKTGDAAAKPPLGGGIEALGRRFDEISGR